ALRIPFGEARAVPDRPLDFVERVLFLRSVGVFSRTNLNALAALSSQLEEVRLPAGTELFREGDEDVAASYWIISGSIACESSIGPRAWRYGPATVVGGIEGVAGMPRWYGAKLDEPLVALRGYAHQFIETLEDDFPTARGFVS